MSPTRPNTSAAVQSPPQPQVIATHPVSIKTEPVEMNEDQKNDYDEKPTDLSMDVPTDLSSSSSRHVNIVCSPDTISLREPQNFYSKDEEKK